MNRRAAPHHRLRADIHALAAALRRPDADPREVWRLADAALDAHDESGSERLELRAEVVWVMNQIAARRPFDADACADRLHAGAATLPTAGFDTRRPLEAACCG